MSECRNSLITVKDLYRIRRLTKKQALVFERQRFSCRVLQVSDSLCWIKVLPLWAKAVWQKHLESNTKQEQQQKRKQQFKKIFIWTLTDSGVSYPANHALWATQKTKVLTAIIDPSNGLDYRNSTLTNKKHIQQKCYITLELFKKNIMF